MATEDGPYEIYQPPFDRQLAMDTFAALPASHPMVALLELDVTEAEAAIVARRAEGVRVSLFAFIVRSIAVAISEHPDLNVIRHGRRIVRFEDVDVSVPVEVETPEGRFPREVVLRRAHASSPAEIFEQIEAARDRYRSGGSLSDRNRWPRWMSRGLRLVPAFARVAVMRQLMRHAFAVKRRAGTTLVTSVGKFASIPGYAFSFSTGPRATAFALGGVFERPAVVNGHVEARSILPVSVMISHDLVDGAPAARFAMRLRELVESADGLSPAPVRERVEAEQATAE